ncbi:MAG: FAD-dependent oxidoreductase [Gemmatimonadales bacterium]|nr:MAG: FAD-dependent oxidoreductase [Gemmatimonadales bacterium]
MANSRNSVDALVVGGGLAGLACANDLAAAGLSVQLLEAGDRPGGRVRTDEVDGYRLDRGFQVLLEAYPECRARLDYEALDLKRFYAGALVRVDGAFHRFADPGTEVLAAIRSATNPVGTLADKLRAARVARELRQGDPESLMEADAPSTLELLREEGFSDRMINQFFRPFFGGVLLDRELGVSGRLFRYYFRMFADGRTSLPAEGMESIPRQLASRLPEGSISTGTRVHRVTSNRVEIADGDTLKADFVVVAVEGPEAARLLNGEVADPGSRGVHCLYFDAPEPPIEEGILMVNGEGRGPVNNVAVLSEVARGYAPPDRSLISMTVVGANGLDTSDLERAVLVQMKEWFGPRVAEWRALRHYHIPHAQPLQTPERMTSARRPVRLDRGLYVCGDHRDNASLNGALASGGRAAESALMDRESLELAGSAA